MSVLRVYSNNTWHFLTEFRPPPSPCAVWWYCHVPFPWWGVTIFILQKKIAFSRRFCGETPQKKSVTYYLNGLMVRSLSPQSDFFTMKIPPTFMRIYHNVPPNTHTLISSIIHKWRHTYIDFWTLPTNLSCY